MKRSLSDRKRTIASSIVGAEMPSNSDLIKWAEQEDYTLNILTVLQSSCCFGYGCNYVDTLAPGTGRCNYDRLLLSLITQELD